MTMTQYHIIAMGDPKSRRWQLSSLIINWYNLWRVTKRHGFERGTCRERGNLGKQKTMQNDPKTL